MIINTFRSLLVSASCVNVCPLTGLQLHASFYEAQYEEYVTKDISILALLTGLSPYGAFWPAQDMGEESVFCLCMWGGHSELM